MFDSLYNVFFGCRHRRTSFPLRPVSKPGDPPGEMYVVCLDCGKRFQYDWDRMRIGGPVPAPAPELADLAPVRKRPKHRFLLAVSTLPFLWLIGKLAVGRRRVESRKERESETEHGKHHR